jgi:hypothetical protein
VWVRSAVSPISPEAGFNPPEPGLRSSAAGIVNQLDSADLRGEPASHWGSRREPPTAMSPSLTGQGGTHTWPTHMPARGTLAVDRLPTAPSHDTPRGAGSKRPGLAAGFDQASDQFLGVCGLV